MTNSQRSRQVAVSTDASALRFTLQLRDPGVELLARLVDGLGQLGELLPHIDFRA